MSRFSSLLLLCIISVSIVAEAQSGSRWGSGIDFTQRAANREKGRWSLTDWLAMKERNRMMDMWLSMNTPSPFEFSLGGAYKTYKSEVTGSGVDGSDHSSFQGDASGYAQFVGLTAEYENNVDEGFSTVAGMFNLRVLGNSIQNTSLTLHFGQQTRTQTSSSLTQPFYQASLQLYLTKYFGIDGRYRYFLPTSNETYGDINANTTEAGVFIDFKIVRIFGTWFKEIQKTQLPTDPEPTESQRNGIRSGVKIFF